MEFENNYSDYFDLSKIELLNLFQLLLKTVKFKGLCKKIDC